MPRIRQLAAITGAAALAVTALGSPAYAVTTEIEKASDGSAYSGAVKATLIEALQIDGGLTGITTCTSASLNGSVDSDGNPLNITSASIGGCSGVASSITFLGLPWGGSVTYDPDSNNPRDGVITLNGFSVRATVFGFVQCTYSGNVSADGFNGSNSSRPVLSNSEAQVDMADITVTKSAGSGLCPASATIEDGAFALTTSANESLQVTGTP